MSSDLINRICEMLGSQDKEMNDLGKMLCRESIDSYTDYLQMKRAFVNTIVTEERNLKFLFASDSKYTARFRIASRYDINAILYERMRRKYDID